MFVQCFHFSLKIRYIEKYFNRFIFVFCEHPPKQGTGRHCKELGITGFKATLHLCQVAGIGMARQRSTMQCTCMSRQPLLA